MKSLEKIEFWNWLYSFGEKPLTEDIFELLKSDFVYKKEQKQSEYEGESYNWDFETLLIDLPINRDYSLCSLFQLSEKSSEYEETLYLKDKDKHYVLGWFDSHNHERVFRFKEFYGLVEFLENILTNTNEYSFYFLFLARYVALTNEKEAVKLMTDAAFSYSRLFDTIEPSFEITKIEPYNNKISGTDLVIKLKKIKTQNAPLHYTINEGVSWRKQKDNVFHLDGFAAHSMRSEYFDKGLERSIDIYDFTTDLCEYKFPYDLWNNLMENCLQQLL